MTHFPLPSISKLFKTAKQMAELLEKLYTCKIWASLELDDKVGGEDTWHLSVTLLWYKKESCIMEVELR